MDHTCFMCLIYIAATNTTEFRCFTNNKGKGEAKNEVCSRKNSKYCVKGTSLEGERKGKTILGCVKEGDVKGEWSFTKTPKETLTCEELTINLGYNGDPSKYEVCICSKELCNGSSTSKVS